MLVFFSPACCSNRFHSFQSPLSLLLFSAHFCFAFVGLATPLESLLVVRELGVQVTTKYVDGREKSTVRQHRTLLSKHMLQLA